MKFLAGFGKTQVLIEYMKRESEKSLLIFDKKHVLLLPLFSLLTAQVLFEEIKI